MAEGEKQLEFKAEGYKFELLQNRRTIVSQIKSKLFYMFTISNAYYCLSREYWKENPHDRDNNISYLDNMDPAAKDVEFMKDTSVVSAIPTMGKEAK